MNKHLRFILIMMGVSGLLTLITTLLTPLTGFIGGFCVFLAIVFGVLFIILGIFFCVVMHEKIDDDIAKSGGQKLFR